MLGISDAQAMYRARLLRCPYLGLTDLNDLSFVRPLGLGLALMWAFIPEHVGAETPNVERSHTEPAPASPGSQGQSFTEPAPDWRLQPFLAVAAVMGSAGESIPIFIEVLPPLVNQNSASEAETHVIFSHLPTGSKLSKGQDLGNGKWKASLSELQDLTLIIEGNGIENAEIEVTAITDFGGGAKSSIMKPLSIKLTQRHPVHQDSEPSRTTYGSPSAPVLQPFPEGLERELPGASPEIVPATAADPPPLINSLMSPEVNREVTNGNFMSDEQMVMLFNVPKATELSPRVEPPPAPAPSETKPRASVPERSLNPSETANPVSVEEAHANIKSPIAQGAASSGSSASAGTKGTVVADPANAVQKKPRAKLSVPEEKLIERGNSFFQSGDLVSARLYYKVAADAGSTRAAFKMARTYDPLVHKEMGVRGLSPDPEQALSWYRRAQYGDDSEIAAHVNALTSWVKSQ